MTDEHLIKSKQLIDTLDKALALGPWNEGSFISTTGKKIKAIRDDLLAQVNKYEETEFSSPEYLAHRAHLTAANQLVYVSLYSLDGNTMESWEKIIANLPRQIVSRPVYAEEKDVQNIIKTKLKKVNEAYVALYVDASAILDIGHEKAMQDKLGSTLLVLKDNAVILDNIDYFMHSTGKYQYHKKQLLKLES